MKRVLDSNGNPLRRPIGFAASDPIVEEPEALSVQSHMRIEGARGMRWHLDGDEQYHADPLCEDAP